MVEIKCKAADVLPLDSLSEFQGGLKRLSAKNLQNLKSRILKDGFISPFIIWKNNGSNKILDGHQRLKAILSLKKDGMEMPDFPVVYVEAENEQDARKKLLSITSQYGEFDEDELKQWVSECEKEFAESLRFCDEELTLTFDETQEETEGDDELPEEVKPITKLGDLWELGEHRVLCGDSTSEEDVLKLMDSKKADMVFTSPPYNAGLTPTESKMNISSKYKNDSDNKNDSDYLDFIVSFSLIYKKVSDFMFINVQSISGNKTALIEYLYELKDIYADTIIWDKIHSQPAMAKNVLNSRFEYIHVFSDKANRSIGSKSFRGNIDNVLQLSTTGKKDKLAKDHHAVFPVELAVYFIERFSINNCIDPFLGSGSTLIAAEKTNRICYGMELDEHYCDVIVNRYKDWCEKNGRIPEIKLNGETYG